MIRLPWSPEEDAIVRALFPVNDEAEVGKLIDRTPSAVANRAIALGLRKHPAYTAQTCARFKRGQVAWNKGTKGIVGVQDACRATQFKKGHLGGVAAERRKPIGALRLADGQLQKKMHDGLPRMSRWVAVQRLVWEAVNGPIPPGHVVVFRDGRVRTEESEITLEVLELISRGENMRRNSYHTRYPKEVAQLIQLRGALNRKINNRTKQE